MAIYPRFARRNPAWICLVVVLTTSALRGQAPAPGPRDAVLLTISGAIEVAPAGTTAFAPGQPNQILHLGDQVRSGKASRASIRLSDKSVLRVYELTTLEIKPPQQADHNDVIDVKSGATYFFNRDKPQETQFQTPSASGAIRGTEFNLLVKEDGGTELTLLDGQVDLTNNQGSVQLQSGQQGTVANGKKPQANPVLNAVNIIQWTLYYPAILDVDELELPASLQQTLAPSLDAYRSGDLLQALAKFPADNPPASLEVIVYQNALLLAVGEVDKMKAVVVNTSPPTAQSRPEALNFALYEMIASVKGEPANKAGRTLATELMAGSYAAQSHRDLAQALELARQATAKSPKFGFAWERLAEMEFSFGHTSQALDALKKSLALSPRNAQALALQGFVLSAQNKITQARAFFEQAVALDGSLANGWLGRGLARIKSADVDGGRQDLETAAALEPNRAFLRSYLGKAWSLDKPFQYGWNSQLAVKELDRAMDLDPGDPTAWLYSALLNDQRNCINQALADLEHSQDLNDNRALFRSKFLLDQDAAVRSANLALIYEDAGFSDVAVREATRAVESDYANYSAHLFLSESYDALIDPKKSNIRYETPWENELLLADLLAPVGAGVVSPSISQQEYSRMFEADSIGISSDTTYWSQGAWLETASQFGTMENLAYSLDSYYYTDPGFRPNNDFENSDFSATVKYQPDSKDTVFLQVERTETTSGDNGQYYNDYQPAQTGVQGIATPDGYDSTVRNHEVEDPNVVFGYHRQWSPGEDTLFIYRNLQDTYTLNDPEFLITEINPFGGLPYAGPYGVHYQDQTVLNSMELQHIFQTASQRLILGGRYQVEDHQTTDDVSLSGTPVTPSASLQTEFNRLTLYSYYQWTLFDNLRLTAGAAYDHMRFPTGIAIPPVAAGSEWRERLSPKAGIDWTPSGDTRLRAAYTRSMGGLFNDSSTLFEPSEVAGFNQAYRTLLEEATVPGTVFETWGLGLDHKFPTRTYVNLEGELLNSAADQQLWYGEVVGVLPTKQQINCKEKDLGLTVNQLIGNRLSAGAGYHLISANVGYNDGVLGNSVNQSTLNELNLFANYYLPCGFYSQFQANWWDQGGNTGFNPNEPGDAFWQFNYFAGYRFPRRHIEIQVGVLNIANQNYNLEPLTHYLEQAHVRTFVSSLKFNF
jgi:tetratricopeptide (TPR) repeat protein